ncbi:MAG: glycosyltransferase family 2 protein [Cycloclasticus sp.]
MPKITIITVCFNAEQYIEQTIQSVISQKSCEFEYIIVDGASTDKTKRIIQQYESQLTSWVSEPDGGIADAMNKGVELATGEYLLFLHADDYLADDAVLSKVISRMQTNVDIHAFDILFKTKSKEILKSTKPLGMRTYFKTPVMHQGAFCKKTLFEQLGGFNTDFKIAMDYDFFYRSFQHNVTMDIYTDLTVSVMRDTGVSSRQDWVSLKQRFSEEKRVHLENNTSTAMRVIYAVYWALYLPYRKVRFFVKHL